VALKRKKRTRIYQNMRVPDVVTAVLLDAGIATKWQLLHPYPVREYCTQYEESDYRFVKRLLAEAGIFFYFPEGPPVSAADLAAASIAGAVGSVADSVVSRAPPPPRPPATRRPRSARCWSGSPSRARDPRATPAGSAGRRGGPRPSVAPRRARVATRACGGCAGNRRDRA
jgi:hypothetical protein